MLGVMRINASGLKSIHGTAVDGADQTKGSCTVNSAPELAALNGQTHAGTFDYYAAKWGGRNGQEKFRTPFNCMHWPVWAWRFDSERRRKQKLF